MEKNEKCAICSVKWRPNCDEMKKIKDKNNTEKSKIIINSENKRKSNEIVKKPEK